MDQTTTENVHKFVLLANQYQDHTVGDLAELFQLPAIDMNVAIWAAEDASMITVDKKTKKITIGHLPEYWSLGSDVEHLKSLIMSTLKHFAKDKSDLEETYFAGWCAGYTTQDIVIATISLELSGDIATYEIEDTGGDSTYTFYCLPENLSKRWGQKQFEKAKALKIAEADKKK